MVMKKREHQSLFLVLSARPNWFYVARTMELPRGQTMVDQSESPTDSRDLREQINLFFSQPPANSKQFKQFLLFFFLRKS